MNKVALIIIYNHQYNDNIELLEKIYKDRFSHIYHLVPFYNGIKKNVIPVYENSFYFQGYVSQGFKSFFRDDFSHYFFIADDLLLNPLINESNYAKHLKLHQQTCYIPRFIDLHKKYNWWKGVSEAYHWNVNVNGVEAENQIPDYETVIKKFRDLDFKISNLRFNQIWKTPKSIRDMGRIIFRDPFYGLRYLRAKITNKKYSLSYPLIGGYADIFVISSISIKQFCHYCGVFAATNLFVEVAIPTSIIMSAKDIVTESNLQYQGRSLWTKQEHQELEKYGGSLNRLMDEFPESYLYLHPVKLSKWSTQA